MRMLILVALVLITSTVHAQDLAATSELPAAFAKLGTERSVLTHTEAHRVRGRAIGNRIAVIGVDFSDGGNSFVVNSTKDISNIVVVFEDGTTQRIEDINGTTFSGEFDETIATIFVKSGNNKSGAGPGYGQQFDYLDDGTGGGGGGTGGGGGGTGGGGGGTGGGGGGTGGGGGGTGGGDFSLTQTKSFSISGGTAVGTTVLFEGVIGTFQFTEIGADSTLFVEGTFGGLSGSISAGSGGLQFDFAGKALQESFDFTGAFQQDFSQTFTR